MSLTDKRKAPSMKSVPSSFSLASSSKRVRINEPSRRQGNQDDIDFFDGDPEIEQEDRRRIRKDLKSGRLHDRGGDLSESESDDNGADLFNENGDDSDAEADAGSHRRRAHKKRRSNATGAAGDDQDEDMFDIADQHEEPEASNSSKRKQKGGDKYLKLGELEEGQDFGSKCRSTLDAADNDAELLRGGDNGDDDLDPDLELEDEDDQDSDDDEGQNRQAFIDLNAHAERSPPISPGGTPLTVNPSRESKSKKRQKLKAPKVTAFNMKEEMQSGRFDADGNYHENQRDPHAQHDVWLAGNYSKSKILEARKAHQKRDREAQQKQKAAQDADGDEDEVKKRLVEFMHRGETVQRTLQRLGKVLSEHKKAVKANQAEDSQVNQASADLEAVTHLSSVLMSCGRLDIYDHSYEALLSDVHKSGLVRQTFDPAAKFDIPATPVAAPSEDSTAVRDGGQWEYRWTSSYLAAAAREAGTPVDPEIQFFGPFSLADLKSWAVQGYFGDAGERILLRPTGSKDSWLTYNEVVASNGK
ncbi:uncharacterized protein MEPE_05088 [Melanopsichium pennsylvanicum]|uniref:GYF domain-containing protein n=2 Tax=Melanopsichium pennsylvanicum TaxID=63383 RepID=A0AAJ4XNU7_9BASI|nr:lin1-like protein [Melanopsichium pennsylvanicum 4]SNX86379.1 uncharacterized protein MEPE_05088 [Melanopsichium pennsylvanicum]